MPTLRSHSTRLFFSSHVPVYLSFAFLLLTGAYGQETSDQADQVAKSVAKIRAGELFARDLNMVAVAGRGNEILPSLEQQFANEKDVAKKGRIASALVKLKDKDDVYWSFLFQQATSAVDTDIPSPVPETDLTDSRKTADSRTSPALAEWAKAHNMDYNAAVVAAAYEMPGKLMLLGRTGDPRAIPLFRRALQAHDPIIVAFAAEALANIQDKDSIPLIIEACRTSSKDMANGIAGMSLIYFDDPRARTALKTYVPEDGVERARRAKVEGRKPYGRDD